jgi:hypothetical protein
VVASLRKQLADSKLENEKLKDLSKVKPVELKAVDVEDSETSDEREIEDERQGKGRRYR